MPVKSFAVVNFEDQMLLGDGCLEQGSLPWLLRTIPGRLFPGWLFEGWRGAGRHGRKAWPAAMLMGLLLLRHSEAGLTRQGAVRRARTDAAWRAALRLPWRAAPPREKTLREFETFLMERHPVAGQPRFLVAFQFWCRLCLEEGLLSNDSVWVADSTPMWCFGAIKDTVRLLGDGLHSLGRQWARMQGVMVREVAREWEAPLLLAKSTKGHFAGTDWSDTEAQSVVLESLAATVNRAVQRVLADLDGVRKSRRAGLARLCQNLLRVVGEDLEANAEGRLQVAYRTSAQRLISHGDPEAQHFRKSRSKVCSGYKLHALADAVSGLVLALLVTPGGEHDSTQLVPLLVHAKSLHEQIDEVLADAAYGGMATRNEALAVTGTRVLAPPLTVAKKEVGLGKGDVSIDFDKRQAICPGGVMTRTWKPCLVDGAQSIAFVWPPGSEEHCTCRDVCPVHKPRTRKDGKPGAPFRRLLLHADEQGLREVRAEWARPETRARYRRRSMWERLMRELTRRGARRAGAWGLGKATLQAHLAAGISNLLILAKRLSEKRRSARLAS